MGGICQFIRDTCLFTLRDIGYWYPFPLIQASVLNTCKHTDTQSQITIGKATKTFLFSEMIVKLEKAYKLHLKKPYTHGHNSHHSHSPFPTGWMGGLYGCNINLLVKTFMSVHLYHIQLTRTTMRAQISSLAKCH